MKGIAIAILLLYSALAKAQSGSENCKDHPLFARIAGYTIDDCAENFGMIPFHVEDGSNLQKEGNIKQISYKWSEGAGKKASALSQIIRVYETIVYKRGGTKVFSCTSCTDGNSGATFNLSYDGRNYWVKITALVGTATEIKGYDLVILSTEEDKEEEKDVEDGGGGMYAELDKTGRVALYINFETGKSIIKPESEPTISAIEQLLADYPTLVISIEGHTDNIGSPASNKTLSLARANAVINSLVKRGVDKNRLSAKGWGQEKPIANNESDEGRAKNRRVEIVKVKE